MKVITVLTTEVKVITVLITELKVVLYLFEVKAVTVFIYCQFDQSNVIGECYFEHCKYMCCTYMYTCTYTCTYTCHLPLFHTQSEVQQVCFYK